MELSIVSTLYRSAPYLPEFHQRIVAAAEQITEDFEIVYVNDGSPDKSQQVAEQLCNDDARARIVELSRNFGHHKAMMTGLEHANGDLVMLIDCDLEEAPEWLIDFHNELHDKSADVVYGIQTQRKGGIVERITGNLFYRLIAALTDTDVKPNIVTARLMRRHYVRSLVAHQDREVFMAGLWATTGFRQTPYEIAKGSKGESSYTFRKRVAIAVNAITSFSASPLIGVFYLGCLILCLSVIGAVVLLVQKFTGAVYSGWTSLMLSVWFLGGLMLFAVGIVGIYLAKIYSEVKRRPYTVIRSVYPPQSQKENAHVYRPPQAG